MENGINYAWPVTSVNREDMTAFDGWFEDNQDAIADKKIIIWGAGIRGTEFSLFFARKGFGNILFTDSNSEKWGGNINGTPIMPPKEIYKAIREDKGKILIATENSKEIEDGLLAEGFREKVDFYAVKTDLYDLYINEFKRAYKRKILVMGDCEFSTISLQDKNTLNLAEMLKKKLGEENCKVLAMHGMGLRSQYHMLKAQVEYIGTPSLLAIMVNPDTLTGRQHLLPRSQHEELLRGIFRLMGESDEEFEQYLREVHKRTQNIQAEFRTSRPEKTNRELHDMKARNYFKLNYLYNLNVETEGLRYLIKILELARETGIKVIPFIPPVNYEYGEWLFGNMFYEKYLANIRKIAHLIEPYDARLFDMSLLLPAEMFAEKDTPDETANERGRAQIMEQMIKEMKGV